MPESAAETVDCPSCRFTYKKYTPFQTLVRACPACGAEAPGAEPKAPPHGRSRFIPRIPAGVVPRSDDDREAAARPGASPTVETSGAAATVSGAVPPMPTPPPRTGPFVIDAKKPGEKDIPVCFGDSEVFQKGQFCANCGVFDRCYGRVLVITLVKLMETRA
jgi:hypothetical protein